MAAQALLLLLNLLEAAGGADALRPSAPGQTPAPAQHVERVEVVGVTPIEGWGLSLNKIPSNVQIFRLGGAADGNAQDVPSVLADRAASIQLSEAQGGSLQPDVLFRGFTGSPLLGASEGLAVYQDGVRINDPFGDTIHWDTLPTAAIESVTLMPGSNPLFGLNALGGAMSVRTKDGFRAPAHGASVTAGSYGRRAVDLHSGGHRGSFGYFAAASVSHERGWREFSPSTVRALFGDLAWRAGSSAANLSVTAADNSLTGNGPAPVELLDANRGAVFTHPDRTDNRLALLTLRARRQLGEAVTADGLAYYRRSRTGTFNGDAADDDDEGEEEEEEEEDAREAGERHALNNISTNRSLSTGLTAQLTRAGSLGGRDNHLVAGAGVDAARTTFLFASELAWLTADRGTTGTGVFDEEAAVDLHSNIVTASAFVTNTWSATGTVAVTASARVNWTSLRLEDQLGTALSGVHRFQRLNPSAGVTYQPRPSLTAYASYAQSSRLPTPVELTCADPEDPCRLPNAFVSDPPLRQIVARTWEGGLRDTSGGIRWTLALFTTDSSDDIIFVSSGTRRGEGHFENVARTRRRGLETTAEYRRADRVSVFGAYTLQQAAFGAPLRLASRFHPAAEGFEIAVSAGDRLPSVPAHTAKIGVAARLTGRVQAGINLRAQSRQFLRGDEANLLPRVPGFVSVNAHGRLRLTERSALLLRVQNMFDTRFYTFGALGDASLAGSADRRFFSPGAPRGAWIGLQVF